MYIRTPISDVDNVIRSNLQSILQLIECRNFPVSRCGTDDRFDFTGTVEAKLSAIDMVSWNDSFQG